MPCTVATRHHASLEPRTPFIRYPTRIALACVLGAAALLGTAAPGDASALSCNERAVTDQAYNGAITGHFTLSCLQQTRRDESPEIRTYSSIDGVIGAAIARAVLRSSSVTDVSPRVTVSKHTRTVVPAVVPRSLRMQATDPSSGSNDVPTPVIVLGVLSVLFVAAGVGTALLRRRLDR
jgi:hypothetical protein